MTDTPANNNTQATHDVSLWRLLRGPVAYLVGALLLLVALIIIIGSANTGPITIRENGNLVDIAGLNTALDIGERYRLKARVRVYGQNVPVDDYDYLRKFADQTDDVQIVVIVHSGDIVEKRWWRWDYIPAPPARRSRLL